MKNKIITAVSAAMILIPWTILPIRTFDWALKSPAAEIIIASYAVLMIAGGIFTLLSYVKLKVQNNLMKVSLVVNLFYAFVGAAALCMMIFPKFM